MFAMLPAPGTILAMICMIAFVALLCLAALEDVRVRRISNWLTATLALLWPVHVITTPGVTDWVAALLLAAAAFALGLVLFARGIMGGGDVKLISAVMLWAGPAHAASFAAVTALTGGALALITLCVQSWAPVIWGHLLALRLPGLPATQAAPADHAEAGTPPAAMAVTLPYGLAIAAGGLAVALQLLPA